MPGFLVAVLGCEGGGTGFEFRIFVDQAEVSQLCDVLVERSSCQATRVANRAGGGIQKKCNFSGIYGG